MNATAKFNLVVAGELVPGASPEAVKNNLAKLFKLPVEKAEVLLNATPRTLQKEVDQATAMKWRAALQRAGLKSSIQPVATKVADPNPQQESSPVPRQAEDHSNKNIEMVGTIRTGGNEFTGPFDVAEVGADLSDAKEELPGLIPSIEHLSMAPPGEDIETLKYEQEPVTPDISHLSYS